MCKTLLSLLSVLSLSLLVSCSTSKRISNSKLQQFKYNYCAPTVPNNITNDPWQETNSNDLSKFNISTHDQLLCEILGITDHMNELWLLRQDSLHDNSAKEVVLKHKIISRILLAQSEIQSISAELDCEGERSDMAASYLDDINSKRNTNLTISAVIVGAITGIASTVTKNPAQTTVAISGGTLGGLLGLMTINPKGKTVEFYHDRNLLRTIWFTTSTNSDYPTFVWKMLHEKKFSNLGEVTLAESIKNRWQQFEFEGSIDPEKEKLLFSTGGNYYSADLHSRSSMLNQLQSTVRSFHQDLTSLITYINNAE
ncbi:hypothetical protein [Flavobacterium sp. '19STA2R22 D10 B1']|uniref:hypothetical protein n=1 Tax=Flavobacterium aerium TaxID=3037261 RepID=UPI00278C4478|nr:hypothetical protein [Flavobacterium sp. '19STA2R22 D10 B1']